MDPTVATARHPSVGTRTSSTTARSRVVIALTALGAMLAILLPSRPVHADFAFRSDSGGYVLLLAITFAAACTSL